MRARFGIATVLLLLLAGCTPVTDGPAAQQPPVSPAPAPAVPAVPIQSTQLRPVIAASPPTRVQVPSVGIDVRVVGVGVQPDGLMELPRDPKIAGWYRFGPDPSDPTGSTVISAHVDSLQFGLGPFSRLRDLPAGAEIIVTTADGTQHRYITEAVARSLKDELPVAELFERSGPPRLVLITCGGQFDTATRTYSDNVIVTAQRLD
jgi:sortase (surface protein transpeptidase)